jgi:hypothetical protein
MIPSTTVRCSGVPYRQGFIEVGPGVHPGFINIECWMIDPKAGVFQLEPASDELPDSVVIANTELELSVARARELVVLLQQAIRMIEGTP